MAAGLYQRLIDKYVPLTEATFLTLVSVAQPIRNTDIPTKIATLTNHQLQIGLGTLYTTLHMLTQDYLIKDQITADDQHIYELTGSGLAVLAAERDRLGLLNQIINQLDLPTDD
ncbi:PadR family transcriptional regulator [Lactiplantibacillus mudanjiangensis]|uniref:Uncharacterized protein n=1 Tax=Lactiplantibacillus mudanjiangensis TaxID=1296538 RepID=A0A660DTS1_9LACO|nr:PadR family transcriptional regulator [Lactiplantibacillus mudanjiangensis]VDG21221.1 hypothetical protein MUDAN_BIHEEGNE_02853 [Lactiplantibacillus mudanjiangensis]VDG22831.1 hypothetical protein MUDAN_IGPPGNFN_00372 [Lactiplantibacillus mudanjiangensis]VDG26597.1 hypothetical protein MUDAN_MDHGFNIF_00036 [Lactiplantibacillus mudanjiangensis]